MPFGRLLSPASCRQTTRMELTTRPCRNTSTPRSSNASTSSTAWPPFLEVSTKYYSATSELALSSQFQGTDTIRTILNVVNDLMIGTYLVKGRVSPLPYTFIRQTIPGTETVSNTGRGNPVQGGTGLFHSFFGPSDDATIF